MCEKEFIQEGKRDFCSGSYGIPQQGRIATDRFS